MSVRSREKEGGGLIRGGKGRMRDPARPRGSGAGMGLCAAGVPASDSLRTAGPSEDGTMC